jgi:hypothetical protein
MHDTQNLCKKIRQVFPDIGECGMDVKVAYDNQKKVYVVDLEKGTHKLKTYLEPEDADACMAGRQCVGLSFQIAQLRSNIESL